MLAPLSRGRSAAVHARRFSKDENEAAPEPAPTAERNVSGRVECDAGELGSTRIGQ